MKRSNRKLIFFLTALICFALITITLFTHVQPSTADKNDMSSAPHEIVVRGRLEPGTDLYQVGAYSIAPTTAVDEIQVAEGQAVQKGEIVATLRNHKQAVAGVKAAETALAVVERRLELVRHPYKDSVIAEQEATVQLRIADLELAKSQLTRSQHLRERGIASEESQELRLAEFNRAGARLREARAHLEATSEVPLREIRLAEAEVTASQARLQGSIEELALTEIRSPINGVVLKIRAKSGEPVSNRQIMDIGDINQPKIVAEVDERLVSRLKIGQSIRISLRGQTAEWSATVSRIGGVVLMQTRPSADTITGTGGRIVEVDATLSDASGLPPIAGLELLVRIQTQ
jgi:ABC exporter DevB family membrane fusion protein